ncbi:hypothetical protein [Catellatospora sp. NPDC049609]|uniref:hypothetical protein n=1 Tax=Catellatospora sp. NPDC049609 TaxID=3155505 RepID=UPI00341B32B2
MAERVTERVREWHAWAGDLDDLSRLGSEVEALYKKLCDIAAADLEETLAALPEPRNGDEGAFRRRILREQMRFRMTAADGHDRVSGEINEVRREMDRRTTTEVLFEAELNYGKDSLSVTLRRNRNPYASQAVRLHVRSHNSGWAREAFAHLSDQVQRGIPWWHKVHSTTGAAIFAGLNYAVIFCTLALLFWPMIKRENYSILISLATLLIFAIAGIAGRLRLWVFPTFEITGSEGIPKGNRVAPYLLTLAASIVIGIIVNRIS